MANCTHGVVVAGLTATMGGRTLRGEGVPYDPKDVNRLFEVLGALVTEPPDATITAGDHVKIRRLELDNIEWGSVSEESELRLRVVAEHVFEELCLKQVSFEDVDRTEDDNSSERDMHAAGRRKAVEVLSWFTAVQAVSWSDLNSYSDGNLVLDATQQAKNFDVLRLPPGVALPNLRSFTVSSTTLHSPFARAFAHTLARSVRSLTILQQQGHLVSLGYVNEYLRLLGARGWLEELTYNTTRFNGLARLFIRDAGLFGLQSTQSGEEKLSSISQSAFLRA